MWRVLRVPAMLVTACCAVGVALAVLLPGRAISTPHALAGLGFDACPPPCWAGIRVGETALDDVPAAFAAHVQAANKAINPAANGAVYWGMTDTLPRSVAFSGNLLSRSAERRVTYLHLNLELPLWYLLMTLGDPVQVELHEPFPDVRRLEMVIYWALPTMRAAAVVPVQSAGDWALFQARAVSLSVAEVGPQEGFGRAQQAWHVFGMSEWQGFAPLGRYLRAMLAPAPGALQTPAI
jgi:hypothetical protein